MAREKTKKEKIKTVQRRNQVETTGFGYVLDDSTLREVEAGGGRRIIDKREALLDYKPELFKRDILRTVLYSLVIIGIEVGLYLMIEGKVNLFS